MEGMGSVKVKLYSGVFGIREVLAAQHGQTGGGSGSGDGTTGGGIAPGSNITIQNPLKVGTVPELLDAIANFLFIVSIPLVTIMILLGAFQLLTAAGNEDRIKRGRRTITWAIVGLAVILIAGGIATLVANILGGRS